MIMLNPTANEQKKNFIITKFEHQTRTYVDSIFIMQFVTVRVDFRFKWGFDISYQNQFRNAVPLNNWIHKHVNCECTAW